MTFSFVTPNDADETRKRPGKKGNELPLPVLLRSGNAGMARDPIRLHGLEPNRDIAIEYIGLDLVRSPQGSRLPGAIARIYDDSAIKLANSKRSYASIHLNCNTPAECHIPVCAC
jgi:hypothetical protein